MCVLYCSLYSNRWMTDRSFCVYVMSIHKHAQINNLLHLIITNTPGNDYKILVKLCTVFFQVCLDFCILKH